MPSRSSVFVPIFLGALGFVFGGVGLFLLGSAGPPRAAARAEALPLVAANQLAAQPIGAEVLVEGRIAGGAAAGFRDFVAWRRERFEGVETSGASKGKEIWKHVETVTPRFQLATPTGELAIVNRDYEWRAPTANWRETTSGDGGIFERRPEGATGFRAGDTVIVEARVVAEPGVEGALPTRALHAAVLSGGNRASYLAALRDGILAAKFVGGVFTAIGSFLAALAAWLFRRIRRAAGAEPTLQSPPSARRRRA